MVQLNSAIANKLDGLANGVLNGHYIYSNETAEQNLKRRFEKPVSQFRNIQFGAFDDEKLLQQYYSVREKSYREVLGLPEFDGGEDYLDRSSYKYLAVVGGNCVGGLRLTVSQPGKPVMMPIEQEGFYIRDLFPQINFDNLAYCEPSRLGLLPEFRNGKTWDELQASATKFLQDEIGVEVLFGRSSPVQTYRFRSQFRALGYKLVIRNDIKANFTPEYEHLKMQFWAVDISKSQKYVSALSVKDELILTETDDSAVFA